jgi:hypothetical protein
VKFAFERLKLRSDVTVPYGPSFWACIEPVFGAAVVRLRVDAVPGDCVVDGDDRSE